MHPEEREDEDWKKISQAFFKTPAPKPSEAFVFQVMEKIRGNNAPAFDLKSFLRWAIPSLGFMMGAILFLSALPVSSYGSFSFEPLVFSGSELPSDRANALGLEDL